MNDAYLLTWSRSHLEGTDNIYDLVLERRAEDADFPSWPEGTAVPSVEGEAVFGASFGTVAYTDFPVNDMDWPIMSRRMLDTLLSVGKFPHVAYPVAIVDPLHYREDEEVLLGPEWYANRLSAAERGYVIVQLTEHLSILDEMHSDLSRSSLTDNVAVFSYVLQEGVELPPLFRVSIGSSQLMVSATGRRALAKARIAGPAYLELSGDGPEVVDEPVPSPELPQGV